MSSSGMPAAALYPVRANVSVPATAELSRLQELLVRYSVHTTLRVDPEPMLTVVGSSFVVWTDPGERTFFWAFTGEGAQSASVEEAEDTARQIAMRLAALCRSDPTG
ncbi:hypothetical protein ABZ470_39655 [Streptosporangium sp. NPDC020072]|uniref:hypothetical protein n=1 Tax=Streptosporangium sp. NPDC020072 TaxID=3154788 RepID=UPI00343028B6